MSQQAFHIAATVATSFRVLEVDYADSLENGTVGYYFRVTRFATSHSGRRNTAPQRICTVLDTLNSCRSYRRYWMSRIWQSSVLRKVFSYQLRSLNPTVRYCEVVNRQWVFARNLVLYLITQNFKILILQFDMLCGFPQSISRDD